MTKKSLVFIISLLFFLFLGATNSIAVENCSPTGTLNGTYTCDGNMITVSTSTVESGYSGTLKSNQSISLKPGFWAKVGSTFSAKIEATVGADTDGDGMPDEWEIQYGLNPNVNDANGDLDNDGVSNLLEYIFHTDPTNPNDKPENTSRGNYYEYDKVGRIKSITRAK